jgi:hypothetical protein
VVVKYSDSGLSDNKSRHRSAGRADHRNQGTVAASRALTVMPHAPNVVNILSLTTVLRDGSSRYDPTAHTNRRNFGLTACLAECQLWIELLCYDCKSVFLGSNNIEDRELFASNS